MSSSPDNPQARSPQTANRKKRAKKEAELPPTRRRMEEFTEKDYQSIKEYVAVVRSKERDYTPNTLHIVAQVEEVLKVYDPSVRESLDEAAIVKAKRDMWIFTNAIAHHKIMTALSYDEEGTAEREACSIYYDLIRVRLHAECGDYLAIFIALAKEYGRVEPRVPSAKAMLQQRAATFMEGYHKEELAWHRYSTGDLSIKPVAVSRHLGLSACAERMGVNMSILPGAFTEYANRNTTVHNNVFRLVEEMNWPELAKTLYHSLQQIPLWDTPLQATDVYMSVALVLQNMWFEIPKDAKDWHQWVAKSDALFDAANKLKKRTRKLPEEEDGEIQIADADTMPPHPPTTPRKATPPPLSPRKEKRLSSMSSSDLAALLNRSPKKPESRIIQIAERLKKVEPEHKDFDYESSDYEVGDKENY